MTVARRRAGRRLAMLLSFVTVASCTSGARPATAPVPFSGRISPERAAAWADSVLGTLSLEDRVAQLVWPWILGDYVPTHSAEWDRLRELVATEHVGGVIISVGTPLDIAEKLNALQRLAPLPLLASSDMEVGAGMRAHGAFYLPNAIELGGATTFPLEMALGATGDTALAYEEGHVTALEGRALGLQIAFGPVLDVNNNPANPVIGARSFSEDPHLVARLGVAYVHGLQNGGMLATGKHFPGHGDTETNSHLALAEVTASRARLDTVELVPFRAAIDAGVGAIMTFHGFLPALDSSGVPATLSPRVMTGLLRHELGFGGLLVTDAMDMKGVVDAFGPVEAAKRAIAAGADVLLMPSDIPGTVAAVIDGMHEGRYDEQRINASVRRILRLKARFNLPWQRFVNLDTTRAVVGDSEHVALARRIAERAIVLARDSSGLVPLVHPNGRPPRVLSITYARRADLGAGTAFDAELQTGGLSPTRVYVDADESAPDLTAALSGVDSADVVVLGSYVNISSSTAVASAPRAFLDLVSGLLARTRAVVLVSFGTPYLLLQAPDVPAYMVAWGGAPVAQRAAARALLGAIPITGRLPISIPPLLPLYAGVSRPGPQAPQVP